MRTLDVIVLGCFIAACGGAEDGAGRAKRPAPKASKASEGGRIRAVDVLARAKKVFSIPPEVAKNPDNQPTDEKVALGRMLYYDTRLSKNHDLSCNSCHDLEQFGIDVRGDRKTSAGHRGQMGDRNAPTVYNAAHHFRQFWDGRAADVEEQAKGPVLNPIEMAMADEASVIATLKSIPGYKDSFVAAFPGQGNPITYDNMGKAIGAFERKLITVDSPFDKFLAGDVSAIGTDAVRGLDVFLDAGCTTCHGGSILGGTSYQKLGATKPYETQDEGRFTVTGDEADKFVFKVPSLRNIAKTGPYLHDGSIEKLESMVQIMAKHQTPGGELDPDDAAAVVAFLDTLTSDIPPERIKKPALPESGPTTPAPDPA